MCKFPSETIKNEFVTQNPNKSNLDKSKLSKEQTSGFKEHDVN